MKRNIFICALMMAAMTPQHIMAQDSNEEMSDNDIDIKSLYEIVSKH